jgi:hypothetical protein
MKAPFYGAFAFYIREASDVFFSGGLIRINRLPKKDHLGQHPAPIREPLRIFVDNLARPSWSRILAFLILADNLGGDEI